MKSIIFFALLGPVFTSVQPQGEYYTANDDFEVKKSWKKCFCNFFLKFFFGNSFQLSIFILPFTKLQSNSSFFQSFNLWEEIQCIWNGNTLDFSQKSYKLCGKFAQKVDFKKFLYSIWGFILKRFPTICDPQISW